MQSLLQISRRMISSSLLPSQAAAYINGQWVPAQSGATFDVTNPVNGEKIASVANCSVADTEAAIAAAKAAFRPWAEKSAKERCAILSKLYQLHMEHKKELATILTKEMGKPLGEAEGEIGYSAGFLDWYAAEGRRAYGDIVPPPTADRQMLAMIEPIGVAGIITPWNFPSAMIVRKFAGIAFGAGAAANGRVVTRPVSKDAPGPGEQLQNWFLGPRPGLAKRQMIVRRRDRSQKMRQVQKSSSRNVLQVTVHLLRPVSSSSGQQLPCNVQNHCCSQAGAALAAGCPVVIKPAEDTPLSALAVAKLCDEAGLPAGVLNVVPSARENSPSIGKLLCESPDIATISFTGSTEVGKILLKQSADTVKRVSLELGGNAPFIVFDSADLGLAVKGAMGSKFRCSGQTCVCANRFYVQAGIHDAFVTALKKAMEAQLKMGDGCSPGVTQGPLINNRQRDKVASLVSDAVSKGAKVVMGGVENPQGGSFFQPTLLTGITGEMEIAHTEIFGPVVPIVKFSTEEEAVALANDCRVGLAGYFYSSDVAQIFRVARRMETGMVGVNEGLISTPEAPFGGVKESGLGREGGKWGLSEFTETKYVCIGGLD